MENRRQVLTLRHMRTLFGVGAIGGQSDVRLLDQFSTGHREAAEAAFATLVERHGPMVLRVCRGVLGSSDDVHDAFQATFLVLVRKSGSLWVRDSLGPWLHGVALRVANKAKVAAARRKAHERRRAELADAGAAGSSTPDDVAPALHDEIERLPGKYRAPIVLCYLEGQTHEGAAAALGWPVGTVRGRLARGRDLLRTRLVRRGVAPSLGASAALLSAAEQASAAPLSESLVQAVTSLVAERSAGVAPAAVAALAEASLRMMTMAKLKFASILILLGLVALGLTEVARARLVQRQQRAEAANAALAAIRQEAAPQPTPPAKSAAEPAKTSVEKWPAGALVRGRVVDHQGAAVAGADVLLLGSEKLTVYADPGPREGTFRYSISPEPATPPPPSVKTDGQGRFSLQNGPSPADRMAVVSDRTLLWELTRKDVPDGNDFVLTLPAPGELRIHAEIPGKPAKLEYWIVGRPPGRVDWGSDCVFCRGIEVPNPGERVLPFLPGQYAVERLHLTPTGIRTNLMSQSERRLLVLESGKRTDSSYDRKTGRAIEGRVRGLEQVKLRYALVTISYFGPEEHFKPDDKPSRMMTTFDVIPISSDGQFTTPPLPPNQYEFRLTGMRASTPAEDGNPYDFQEAVNVKITEAGAASPVEIVVKTKKARPAARRTEAPDPKKPRLELHAHDESGAPVKDFEAQLFAPQNASYQAAMGTDGVAIMAGNEVTRWKHGDLIVSAAGFASTIEEMGPIEGLRKVDVTLKRGKKIRLRVRDSSGKPISPDVMPVPLVYLPRYRGDAWSAGSIKDTTMRERTVAAINFLNVRREAGGDFTFNVQTDQATRIYFGFSHPDVLLYFETAPVTASELAGGIWDVVIPQPATLAISIKPPQGADGKPLYAAAYYSLVPNKPGFENAAPGLESGELKEPDWQATLPRLAPGAYGVYIQTTPRDAATRPPSLDAHPGVFHDRRKIEVKAGERTAVAFEPAPLNADAWRGTRAATVLITPASDRPLGGEPYRVSYTLLQYGRLPIVEGKLDAEGRIALENITASGKEPVAAQFFDGEYSVEVAGEYVGKFAVKDGPERQTFSFRMAPRPGDLTPADLGQDLETGRPVRSDELRGRVVFLEFWATWCGPCQEPMTRLVELGNRRGDSWRDDVALVAVGIDKDREDLRRRVLQNGATTVRQLWSPDNEAEKAGSAYGSFKISGVPTSFLIGRDGRIVWRGHPASIELERKLDELIGRK